MKGAKARKRLAKRIETYDATSAAQRIDSRGRKRPGSMSGRK